MMDATHRLLVKENGRLYQENRNLTNQNHKLTEKFGAFARTLENLLTEFTAEISTHSTQIPSIFQIKQEDVPSSGASYGASGLYEDQSAAESEAEVDEGTRLLNEIRNILDNSDTEDTDDVEETHNVDHDDESDTDNDIDVAYTFHESVTAANANMVDINDDLADYNEDKCDIRDGEVYYKECDQPKPDPDRVVDIQKVVDSEQIVSNEPVQVFEQLQVTKQLLDTNPMLDTGTDITRISESETVAVTETEGRAEGNNFPRTGPRYLCKHCQYIATSSIDLRRHMYKSHYFAPVECDICQKVLSNKYVRNKHMRTDHGVVLKKKGRKNKSVISTVDTRIVNQQFVEQDLNRAPVDCNGSSVSEQNTTGLPQTISSSEYKCDGCPFSGKNRRSLMMHMRHVHSSVRYKCGLCKYSSNFRSKVATHTAQEHNHEDWMKRAHQGDVWNKSG